jgi:dimeric dUTPase (all-alpha-NTP-PPase superfamily)
MNITHAVEEKFEGDRLQMIFTRQKELMEKYHGIEERSGLFQTSDCPVNLDDKRGQARIKDFSWRVTEELGEALDAKKDEEHYQEELIDGLHFLTELTILAGKDYNTISHFSPSEEEEDYLGMLYSDGMEQVESMNKQYNMNLTVGAFAFTTAQFTIQVTQFINDLGMMCNCLKNKPWKQSQMLTDKKAFQLQLERVWVSYMAILHCSEMTPKDIVNIYLKKSQVNKFRQRSNY